MNSWDVSPVISNVRVNEINHNKTRTTIVGGKDKRKGTEVKCIHIRNIFNYVVTNKRQKEQKKVISS